MLNPMNAVRFYLTVKAVEGVVAPRITLWQKHFAQVLGFASTSWVTGRSAQWGDELTGVVFTIMLGNDGQFAEACEALLQELKLFRKDEEQDAVLLEVCIRGTWYHTGFLGEDADFEQALKDIRKEVLGVAD
jgi:hypothetical protein